MNLIELTELALRTAGLVTVALLMLIVALRGGWRQRADLLAVLACVAAYLVCSSPTRLCISATTFAPALVGAIVFPFAFWRLARVVLEDDRTVPALAWVGLVVLLLSGVLAVADYLAVPAALRGPLGGLHKAVTFAFVLCALVRAWRSWAGDLIAQRRRLRGLLVGYLGLYSLSIAVVEVVLQGAAAPVWLDMLNVALIDLSLVGTMAYLVGPRADAVDVLFTLPMPAAPATPLQGGEPLRQQADAAQVEQLGALMAGQKLYRNAELSVASLALAMQVPEYVLRRLIHTRLGHRNFPAFVNDYRLREVVERMADPALERRPILTLALEAGFGSIGPFNRLFRARYGMTPSEFRARGEPLAQTTGLAITEANRREANQVSSQARVAGHGAAVHQAGSTPAN